MKIDIKEATIDDASMIADIHINTMSEVYKGILTKEYLYELQKLSERDKFGWDKRVLDKNRIDIVAKINEEVVGFISGGKSLVNEYKDYKGEIYAFYIKSEYQGKGIGCKLYNAIISKLKDRGFSKIYVQIFELNNFKKFYIKKGGIKLGEKLENIGGMQINIESYGFDLSIFN